MANDSGFFSRHRVRRALGGSRDDDVIKARDERANKETLQQQKPNEILLTRRMQLQRRRQRIKASTLYTIHRVSASLMSG